MKRMTALLLLICSGAAYADEASHRRLAEELMGLTQTEATVRNWRKNFDNQAQEVVSRQIQGRSPDQLSEAQAASVRRFNERGAGVLNEALDWGHLQDPLAKLYMQTFNEGETRELVAFYKSPLGQKMLTGLPALSDGVAGIVRSQIDAVRPRLQAISQDFQAEYAQTNNRVASAPALTATSAGPKPAPAPEPVVRASHPRTKAPASKATRRAAPIKLANGKLDRGRCHKVRGRMHCEK